MGSPVSPLWNPPSPSSVVAWQPVTARQLVTMASAENHLSGIQARGFAPASVYQRASYASAASSDVGYRLSEPPNVVDCVCPYWVPPGVELLHIVLIVLSDPEPDSPNNTSITVTIEDQSGSSVDDGCTWQFSAGTLPGSAVQTTGERVLRPYVIESGTRFSSLDPTSGSPTPPRRLSVSGKGSSIVLVRVAGDNAAVVGLHIIPLPPESIA